MRTGPHFVVHFHAGKLAAELTGRLADEALAAAEYAWAPAERLLGTQRGELTTIHVHAAESAYRTLARQHSTNNGFLPQFLRHAEKEAQVAMLPELAPADLTILGLPRTTKDSIVLVAAEAFASQRAPVVATDPWLAQVFAYGVLEGKQAQASVYGVDFVFDNRRFNYAGRDDAPMLQLALMSKPPKDGGEFTMAEEIKVFAAQLFAGSGNDWARKLLQSPSKALKEVRFVREAAVERMLGKDWAKTQAKWHKQIKAAKVPFSIASPLVTHLGKRLVLVGNENRSCTVYAEDPVPAGAYRILATCELTSAATDSPFRIQLDAQDAGMLGVWLRKGRVHLDQWTQATDDWDVLVEGKAPITRGIAFTVAIEVGAEPGKLVVRIDGQEVLRWDCSKRTMRGKWSLANGEGVGYVEGLRIEPITAPGK